jgi:hypothetical protein
MKEIFAESGNQAGHPGGANATLLGVWWAAWLVTGIASHVLFRMTLHADEIDEFRAVDNLSIFVGVMDLVATGAFILMVKRLSALQEQVCESPPAPQPVIPGADW